MKRTEEFREVGILNLWVDTRRSDMAAKWVSDFHLSSKTGKIGDFSLIVA